MQTTTFADSGGRQWSLKLDPLLIRAVDNLCKIRLTDLSSDPFARLTDDPLLICDVLWVICEPQAITAGVSVDEFYRSLDGSTIASAAAALEVAVTDFFLPETRSKITTLRKKNQELRAKAMDTAMAKLNDPAITQRLETALSQQAELAITQALERSGFGGSADATSAST